jgi:hypothetical protein
MKTKTYCRKDSDSDVHVVRTLEEGQEGMECVGCSLKPDGESFVLPGTWMQYPMLLHLNDHDGHGHKIPYQMVDTLDLEIHA